ncbi:hypothetical protein [uncultured Microscilla sp.]|uniref:hypothetical protein n=1 Tax=uncultured Microscilla sp. TaxID=432653 RepID=UPI002603FBAA|nr:hypothetical protein [uncultured Microscilla sp.]
MDLQKIESELKKRLIYPYKWGRKQSNSWDRDTNFIYQTDNFQELEEIINGFNPGLKNYTLNRWYNFWSAKAVEFIFATHENVMPHKDQYDKLVDFSINGVQFDHKTSNFPKKLDFDYYFQNKKELIEWLYKNQSQQGRKHLKNRLFLVLYNNNPDDHWELKADIPLLKSFIDKYILDFSENKLVELNFGNGEVLSDIIWVKKSILRLK